MHVFVSYLRNNSELVDRLTADLRANGVTVWLDRDSIRPGEDWQTAIRSAIRSGAYFLACFSAECEQREMTYMDDELDVAVELMGERAGRSWFLPLQLSSCDMRRYGPDRAALFASLQWVDLSDNWDRGLRQIIEAVSGGLPSHHYLRGSPPPGSDPYEGTDTAALFLEVVRLTKRGDIARSGV
jgi:hypothetical protein